jgi:hypothetical protein
MAVRESRQASFGDLRAFLRERAGHRVGVTVEAPQAVEFASIRAYGLLAPVSDVEQLQAVRAAFRDPDFDDPGFIEAHADFRLLDITGRETLEVTVFEPFTSDLELGAMKEIYRADVAGREWIEFTLAESQSDDEERLVEVPDWRAAIRITEYAQRSISQLIEEVMA